MARAVDPPYRVVWSVGCERGMRGDPRAYRSARRAGSGKTLLGLLAAGRSSLAERNRSHPTRMMPRKIRN